MIHCLNPQLKLKNGHIKDDDKRSKADYQMLDERNFKKADGFYRRLGNDTVVSDSTYSVSARGDLFNKDKRFVEYSTGLE